MDDAHVNCAFRARKIEDVKGFPNIVMPWMCRAQIRKVFVCRFLTVGPSRGCSEVNLHNDVIVIPARLCQIMTAHQRKDQEASH